jgi:hypothetical protein
MKKVYNERPAKPSKDQPVIVSEAVADGIKEVRNTGKTNMMEWRRVQRIADELELYELVVWLQDHQEEYLTGLVNGFEVENLRSKK